MSTWTSRAAACLLALAAPAAAEDDRIAVRAPQGYCAAPVGRTVVAGNSFVAFIPCAGSAVPRAVLTATLGPPGSALGIDLSGQALADYVTSPDGRRGLSRAGRADSVRVHEVIEAEGAVLIRLTDTAPAPDPMERGESWRAVLALSGRLVTLTAAAADGTSLARNDGRALIGRFVRALRNAN
jgi:hypothetical protein